MPSEPTVVVNVSPLMTTVIVSPAVPVPLMVGVVSLVMPSPAVPVSLALSNSAVSAGALVSATLSVAEPLLLPAASVAVAV